MEITAKHRNKIEEIMEDMIRNGQNVQKILNATDHLLKNSVKSKALVLLMRLSVKQKIHVVVENHSLPYLNIFANVHFVDIYQLTFIYELFPEDQIF